ncbi:MAG: prephenate dehydrogenase/arogenate dehydrogenase family protein [Anaerolineae bacterium]
MADRPRITIIGLGFIGTSLAQGLARLRTAQSNYEIVGHDRDSAASNAAKKVAAFDKIEWNLINATEPADMIFIATPVQGMRETMEAMGKYLKPGVIVTDTGGSKSQVLRWAQETLPDGAYFIGGDPLLGREGAPVAMASADVFQKAVYCLSPSPTASPDAINVLASFVTGLGAQPFFVDPDEHDGLIAGVGYAPVLLAAGLMNAVYGSRTWTELQRMAGANFKEFTAPLALNPTHWQGLIETNGANMARWLDLTIAELQNLRATIGSGDPAAIEKMLDGVLTARLKLDGDGKEEDNVMDEVGKDRFRQMFLGSIGQRKKK